MKSIRRRALRAGVVVLLVTTVSLAGASIKEWWRALPPPAECSSEDLLRWLATRDLAQESLGTRRALVDRMAAQLGEGIDLKPIEEHLNVAQKRRFTTNVRLLMATWFKDAAANYADLDSRQKAAFLDEHIALVQEWDLKALAGVLALGESAGAPSSEEQDESPRPKPRHGMSEFALLNGEINRWVDGGHGAQRLQLERFASAIRMRLLARAFQPFTSSSAAPSS